MNEEKNKKKGVENIKDVGKGILGALSLGVSAIKGVFTLSAKAVTGIVNSVSKFADRVDFEKKADNYTIIKDDSSFIIKGISAENESVITTYGNRGDVQVGAIISFPNECKYKITGRTYIDKKKGNKHPVTLIQYSPEKV